MYSVVIHFHNLPPSESLVANISISMWKINKCQHPWVSSSFTQVHKITGQSSSAYHQHTFSVHHHHHDHQNNIHVQPPHTPPSRNTPIRELGRELKRDLFGSHQMFFLFHHNSSAIRFMSFSTSFIHHHHHNQQNRFFLSHFHHHHQHHHNHHLIS